MHPEEERRFSDIFKPKGSNRDTIPNYLRIKSNTEIVPAVECFRVSSNQEERPVLECFRIKSEGKVAIE